ncbi:hypothetical protein KUL152_04980 [Tenacibaculum sp. KUL152]|nr:hypothetical protein KUL152_04980 [Tenacibaculum sp. KUL152]
MKHCEILIVDDDAISLEILENTLTEFQVVSFTSPKKALTFAQQLPSPPALIVLDIMMPEMNGFDMCTELREIFNDETTDIVFCTSSSELEERLKGFEVGATDFIIKPIVPSELQRKADKIVSTVKFRKQSLEDSKATNSAVKVALSTLGEQNNLVHFLRAAHKCNSVESLNRQIVKSMSDYGLKAIVRAQYQVGESELVSIETSEVSVGALESELLSRLSSSDRIMTRGRRLFLNYPPFTQIVKNMPDDEDFAGRLRDYLAIILEAAVQRYQVIVLDIQVAQMIEELDSIQKKAEKNNQDKMQTVLTALTSMVASLEARIFDYGLSEFQEDELLRIFKDSTDKTYQVINASSSAEELEHIMSRLKSIRSVTTTEPIKEENNVEFF